MEFKFTEEQENWRKEVREFFTRESPPELVRQLMLEKKCTNPLSMDLYLKMAQKGWFKKTWPREYGGEAKGRWYDTILSEEMGYCLIPRGTWNLFANTVQFLGNSLLAGGTDEQKRRWLPLIASGQLRTSNGITEPNAGSDVSSIETTAREENDYFVVNGTKVFNHAHGADYITTIVRTDPSLPKRRGMSVLLIDLRSAGVSVNPTLMALSGWVRSEVSFQDVRVPKANLLGEKNKGWDYLMGEYLPVERVSVAAVDLGELFRVFEELVDYVRRTRRDGQLLIQVPHIRSMLADMWLELLAARLLIYHTIWKLQKGESVRQDANMAKLYFSEVNERFCNAAMDILGRYGELEMLNSYAQWLPLGGRVSYLYSHSRVDQIGGGTSEVLRNQIAVLMLGLPRG
jgi:alkylation response protein AidB-like acyl-CoA dehydrogenase